MFFDRVKYKLIYNDEIIDILEPIEWDDISKDFIRNKTYHGIFVSLTELLTFTGDTRKLIVDIFESDGVNADVKFIREIKNEYTDIWETDFVGTLDFMTIIIEFNKVKIKVASDDILTKLESKKDAEIEVERLTDLYDKPIAPVAINKVYINGRMLLYTGILERDPDWWQVGCDNGDQGCFAPAMKKTEQSEIDDLVFVQKRPYRTDVNNGYQEEMFIGYNDSGSTLDLRIKVKIGFPLYIFHNDVQQYDTDYVDLKLRIVRYGTVNNNFIQEYVLWNWDASEVIDNLFYIDIDAAEVPIIVGIEESLSLQFLLTDKNGGKALATMTEWCWNFDGNNCEGYTPREQYASITVQQDSVNEPSNSNFILVHDFADKMIRTITGANFRSKLLGRKIHGYIEDGYFSSIGILHGMWLRGITNNIDNYKALSIQWKDFYSSLDSVCPVGLSLEGDTIVIEDRIEFYTPEDRIDLGEVVDLEISVNEKDYYSLIDIGYEKAGGYDEKQGLDDPNRKTQYSTILTKIDNILKLVSEIRSDSYGLETVRRETKDLTSDTSFDDNKWWLELIEVPDQYWEMAPWTDKFDNIDNIYSKETAMNIWFSPINIILRHGKWLRPSLRKYIDSKILYVSSEGNSSLVTKLKGGIEYSQNDGVPVEDLDYPVHYEITAKFKAKMLFNIDNRTNNKRDVYGLIKFTYRGIVYRAFLESVKVKNNIGEFIVKLYE